MFTCSRRFWKNLTSFFVIFTATNTLAASSTLAQCGLLAALEGFLRIQLMLYSVSPVIGLYFKTSYRYFCILLESKFCFLWNVGIMKGRLNVFDVCPGLHTQLIIMTLVSFSKNYKLIGYLCYLKKLWLHFLNVENVLYFLSINEINSFKL